MRRTVLRGRLSLTPSFEFAPLGDCWQAELRPHGIRVVCICPSEVQTEFGGRGGRNNPNKLFADDIAGTIMGALEMPRRVLWTERAIFASNPWKED